MAQTPKIGRRAIFRGKEGGHRVQAIITKHAGKKFKAQLDTARADLAALYEIVMAEAAPPISDADALEFMARGAADTREYLEKRKK